MLQSVPVPLPNTYNIMFPMQIFLYQYICHKYRSFWSANGDNLVPTGSKGELTKVGQLVLSDPTGT